MPLVVDEQEEADDCPATWSFPLLPVALLVLYKLIFYFSLSLTSGPSLFGPLGIIVISLIALIGTLFFFQSFTPTLLYRLSLPFMVAGLLLLAWLHMGSVAATMSYYEELVWRCQRVARSYGLTHREEEVLELLVQGFSNARIEESLVISHSTTKTHIRHLHEKLGVHSREEARALVEGV